MSTNYIAEIGNLYKDALTIVVERNAKYAAEDNPFKNFQSAAKKAGTTVEQGILTRLGDKESRLQNLLAKGGDFDDETVKDTFVDILNYTNILYQWITWGKYQYEVVTTMTQAEVDAANEADASGEDEREEFWAPPIARQERVETIVRSGRPAAGDLIISNGVKPEEPKKTFVEKVSGIFRGRD
jgi:hypothetical protein